MTTPRKFHMRDGVLADVPRFAEIGAHAFIDDGLYEVLSPKRREFFDDYQQAWQVRLRTRFLQPGAVHKVIETDVEENGKLRREIVGWAGWIRMGSSEAAKRVNQEGDTLLRRLEYRFIDLEEKYARSVIRRLRGIPLDRSADVESLKKFREDYPVYMSKTFSGEYEEHWHLSMLAVDPKWQRNGIGQMLVRWGLERAQEEGICAGLESSLPGCPMYLRLGFEEIGRFHTPKKGLTFPALIWRPVVTGA